MSPKKKSVTHKRVAARKSEQPSEPQTASERKAVENAIQQLISKHATAHQRLVKGVRRWLRKRLPSANEIVYEYNGFFVISYSPNENGYDGVLTLRASEKEVKLYFNFAQRLPDPEKRLKGSGKQAKSITLDRLKELSEPSVANLIEAAIDNHPTPFKASSEGRILIKQTAAAKKRG